MTLTNYHAKLYSVGFKFGLVFAQTTDFMNGANKAMGYVFIIGAMIAIVGVMAGGIMVMTGKGTEHAKLAAVGAVIVGGAAALVGGIFTAFNVGQAVPKPTFQ